MVLGTEGEGALRVIVSTAPLPCAYFTAAYPERPAYRAGSQLDFWLMQPVESDGKPGRWSFRSAYFVDVHGGRGLTTRAAMLDDVLVLGDTVTIKGLELALSDGRARSEMLWNGDLEAKDCGRVARKETSRPQQELTLTLAGAELAINGATVRPSGDQHFIRLTRAPHDCDSIFTEGYDMYIDLVVKGEPPKLQFASLNGDVFPESPSGSDGIEKLGFVIDGPLGGDGAVKISADGTLGLRGYQLGMKGSFEATRCNLPGAEISGSAMPEGSAAPTSSAKPAVKK